MRSIIRRGASCLGAAAAIIAATEGTAQAGPGDNGTDPRSGPNVCANGAQWIATRGIETELGQVVTNVDVYYSPRCLTNWISVRSNPAGGRTAKDLGSDTAGWLPTENDYGTGASISMQVYAPGSSCIHFQVHLYYPNGSHYAETYVAGSNTITIC
ncbi:hypothetical protein [Amycolatopsis sp. NPDC004625]|uniref:hypothetical protein n=1 Tax=Amycolatopsis sp. NPDC004625 TaxID=3154670 RepID=UPI0033A22F6C